MKHIFKINIPNKQGKEVSIYIHDITEDDYMYASSSLDGSLVTLRRKEKVEIGSKKVFIFKIPVLPLENYISLKKYYLTENKEKDEK